MKPIKASPDINDKAKILLFDIESTHLRADFGTCLCIGWKWLGEKTVHVPAITDYPGWQKDPTDDSRLLRDIAKVLVEADIWVTYNGKRFDVPYIQSKLVEHNLPFLPNTPHVDLYWTVKGNLLLTRKSLANVLRFLKLENEKTNVDGRIWKRATTGHGPSIKYIVDHCRADVLILEEAYMRLRPLVRTHPRVNGWGPCAVCGKNKLQSRGKRVVPGKYRRRRLACTGCGAWESRPI